MRKIMEMSCRTEMESSTIQQTTCRRLEHAELEKINLGTHTKKRCNTSGVDTLNKLLSYLPIITI